MTRKLSITTAVAVAALSVGAPAAFGQGGQLSGSVEPVLAQPDPMIEDGFAQAVAKAHALGVGTYRDAHERGLEPVSDAPSLVDLLAAKNGVVDSSMLNTRERGLGDNADTQPAIITDPRHSSLVTRQRALKAREAPFDARSDGLNRLYGLGEYATSSTVSNYKDAFERAVPPQGTVTVSAPSSGTEIEWPQVGVGLGIGLLLALGLGLIMRVVHVRPFAH